LLNAAFIIAVVLETTRFSSARFQAFFTGLFGRLLRPRESDHLTGATGLLAAGCIITLFLPLPWCSLILSQHILGDAAAALAGRAWGRPRFGGKSLEGSAAYLGTSILVLVFFRWQILEGASLAPWLAAALFLTALEFISSRGWDNLLVPALGGTAYFLLTR
jgi:dolichol kinase